MQVLRLVGEKSNSTPSPLHSKWTTHSPSNFELNSARSSLSLIDKLIGQSQFKPLPQIDRQPTKYPETNIQVPLNVKEKPRIKGPTLRNTPIKTKEDVKVCGMAHDLSFIESFRGGNTSFKTRAFNQNIALSGYDMMRL